MKRTRSDGTTTVTATLPASTNRARYRAFRGERLTAYLFILPAVFLIAIFGIFPIGYTFYMSLYRWRIRKGSFIGFDHYSDLVGNWAAALAFMVGLAALLVAHWLWTSAFAREGWRRWRRLAVSLTLMAAGVSIALGWRTMMALGDDEFLGSLVVTLYYALGTVPVQIALALVLATLLFQKIRGKEGFRMIYFLPYVTPQVAAAVVFAQIFSPRGSSLAPGSNSVANQVLAWFRIEPQRWLFEPRPLTELLFGDQIAVFNGWLADSGVAWQLGGLWLGPSLALVSIILFGVWTYTGLNVVIFLAGLGGIPVELYEAAEIDGANSRQRFWSITIPLLSPVTYYLTLLGFIGTLQAFSQLYVMRSPFARGTVDTASIMIFDTFYKSNNFSLAAAQSFLLFFVILFVTITQQRVMGRKVFYG
ncbi:MAG: sugar ABC transporter permease [Trueperaceae bacterium]